MEKTNNEIATEEKLLESLEIMFSFASSSLSRIRGIAKCAIASLETDYVLNDLEAVAECLKSIIFDAEMAYNDVGCEAATYGINTLDPNWFKRMSALSKARKRNTVTNRP